MDISVVLTTYNWPSALELVVNSLLSQQTQASFELVIADDGSQLETKNLIDKIKSAGSGSISIHHVWQEDQGFRAAACRNKAVAQATGAYIIFIDGDCIVPNYFIQRHYELAKTGFFVGGNRMLLSESFTQNVLTKKINLADKSLLYWCFKRLQGYCSRVLPLLKRSLGAWRESKQVWQGIKTCNMGVWRADVYAVNGFDESFTGWGYEDSDFAIRLLRAGLKRLDGRYYAPVFHLWHRENSRGQEQENLMRLQQVIDGTHSQAHVGINQYLN
ncbi:Hyaluronan synthase [Piscirickettsia salmonis]|uniref:glycosyltransferase family 2 protein n=1 Tax=Piscirickettsia salmonis TaxID=1238 RepID=UPI0012B8A7E5|nr:glycosyltransferase family 2 protein [Piscirickettsia salmonis]QGP51158.1 Hyaluronan synthase [Piscirickettsia salmonis]